jgi:hypothetical protein
VNGPPTQEFVPAQVPDIVVCAEPLSLTRQN